MPEVSVLMPVYNGAPHLALAVESILGQTFTDFEFIIIDDCSTDDTPAILDRYPDPRIVRLRNTTNQGITATLNRGLDVAQGALVARMDADDRSYPDRLALQVAHLRAHPQIGLLGMRYVIVDEAGRSVYGEPSPPEAVTPTYAAWSLLWMTTVQHPTAMLRREILTRHDLRYNPAYETAEDYELWAQLARHGGVEMLWETGLDYRVSAQSISQTRRARQIETHHRIMHREISRFLGRDLDVGVTRDLLGLFVPGIPMPDTPSDLAAAAALLLEVRARFFTAYPVTAQERGQIDLHIRRALRRALSFAPAGSARWALRRLILRAYPLDFARLSAAFVRSKASRRTPTLFM